MADFGKSLGNLALAATVTFAPMQAKAADASKLPESVVANCKAKTTVALADLKTKMDAAAPTSTPELNAQRMERYTIRFSNQVGMCLDTAALEAQVNELKVANGGLKEIDAELDKKLAFFEDFMEGRKTRAEYNAQIAGLTNFVEKSLTSIAVARKTYSGDVPMAATFDRIEKNLAKVAAYNQTPQQEPSFRTASLVK